MIKGSYCAAPGAGKLGLSEASEEAMVAEQKWPSSEEGKENFLNHALKPSRYADGRRNRPVAGVMALCLWCVESFERVVLAK